MLGAVVALVFTIHAVPGGIAEILLIADEKAKLTLIDLSTDPTKLTLWAAVLGCTLFEFGSTAIDQTVTQRALCCSNLKEARKAIAFSAIGIATTWLMAGVGLGIVAFYHLNPLSPEVAAAVAQEPDRIFPYFVIHQLPPGVSGIIIAAIFAAGISTLDSALAALSQVSVMGLGQKLLPNLRNMSEQALVKLSRITIIFWGLLICTLAIVIIPFQDEGLLALGFKASGVVYGSLIGIAVLALMRRGQFVGIVIATLVASMAVIWLDVLNVNFFWWYPVGAIITVAIALLFDCIFPVQKSEQGRGKI
jgi:Na+/proline symporter